MEIFADGNEMGKRGAIHRRFGAHLIHTYMLFRLGKLAGIIFAYCNYRYSCQ